MSRDAGISTPARGILSAHAQAFVPSHPASSPNVEVEDVDVNAYIRQTVESCHVSSRSSSSASSSTFRLPPSPTLQVQHSGKCTPTEEEFDIAEEQWRDQANAQWGDQGENARSPRAEKCPSLESSPGVPDAEEVIAERATQAEDGLCVVVAEDERSVHGLGVAPFSGYEKYLPATIALANLSSFATMLTCARAIENLDIVPYPEGIRRVDSKLNAGAHMRKFRYVFTLVAGVLSRASPTKYALHSYDRNFLLQFEIVCTDKPTTFPSIQSSDWLRFIARAPCLPADSHCQWLDHRDTPSPIRALAYKISIASSNDRAGNGQAQDGANSDAAAALFESDAASVDITDADGGFTQMPPGGSASRGSPTSLAHEEDTDSAAYAESATKGGQMRAAWLTYLEARRAFLAAEMALVDVELARLQSMP